MSAMLSPIEVFCSYAHEDEPWMRRIETHLNPLKRKGLLSLWYDRLLLPGSDWSQVIDNHLETASVILLLISADFLASDYCFGVEMQRALARQKAGEIQVIPILLRPVDWEGTPFDHLHALPTDAKPITTWPNEDTALADVTAGIRRVLEELSLLPASTPRATLPAIWNIPYSRNPFFLGRDTELALLRNHLQAGQATALSQPQAISGLGGIGKTQVALEYAYRFHQDYRVILWGKADSTEALISSYIAIALLLRLPEHEAKEQEITVQAVKHWLQMHRDWLLILDNADDLAPLANFLPPMLGGHLLLTTRATATKRLAHRLEIETLHPEQGALLLLRRATLLAPDATLEQTSREERKLAMQISQELGGLPLALDQAGAYLEETGTGLAEYLLIYQHHRRDLLQRRGGLVDDHPSPVATTWSLSFQQVEERNQAAAELLRLCAFLAPDAIAEEILVQGASMLGPVLAPIAADIFQLNQAIEVLRAYSLMQRDPREKTLSIHRLVQAVLQDTMEQKEQLLWAKRAILAVNAAFPQVEYEMWSLCERLLAQALGATQRIEQYHTTTQEASRLLYETASYLMDRARYTEAEPLYQRALHIREQQLGPDHHLVAYPLTGLAILHYELGQYPEAEPLYLRALHIREQQLGPDHHLVAHPLHGLANLYRQQGQYAEAELLYQRALHIREQQLGPNHLDVATSLYNLAILYREQGQYAEAEPLYQRALYIMEQQLKPDHHLIANPVSGLANLYREQGQYDLAEPLYLRALHIREQQLGPDHPDVSHPINNLANLYRELGKYDQAESLYLRALRIREQQLGPDHPDVAYPLNNLANLYRELGRYDQAEPFFKRALSIREQRLGPDHHQMAYPLTGLANLYCELGKFAEAEPLYLRALHIREQQLGPDHHLVAHPLTGLANLYCEQGRYAEVEPLHQRALHIRELRLGPDHPQVAYSLTGLANFYKEQGKFANAEPLFKRALHIRELQLGPNHPQVAHTLAGLANLYKEQGKDVKAETHYQRALTIQEKVLGLDHPDTTTSLHNLASLYESQGKYEQLQSLLKKSAKE